VFQIRKEHDAAFVADLRERFLDRLLDYLEEVDSGRIAALPPGAWRSRIRRAVEQARAYGIDTEDEAAEFVELTLALGDGFESAPGYRWAALILNDPALTGGEKLEALQDRLALEEEIRPSPAVSPPDQPP
jgi:hypothetical protein